MKIQKVVLVGLCVVLIQSTVFAQAYTFKVMVNKGKTELKSGAQWLPIKVGQNLDKDDEIRLAENAYIGLVHTSGKPHEIKKSGKYNIADEASKIGAGTSVLNKYTDFILSSTTNPKNKLNATGAVHRGFDAPLNLPSGDKGVVFNDEILINWDTDKMTAPYVVEFKSLFDDVLYSVETTDQFVKVNLADKNFDKEDNILVSVTSKSGSGKSEKYSLKRLSKNDLERIKNLIKENNINIDEPSALGKLFLARFYEENGLLIDAATVLQKAVMQEPDVSAYKDAYTDFLYRTGIKGIQEQK